MALHAAGEPLPRGSYMSEIRSVGVIGAGQMGSGIAHVIALGGYDVLLHDVSPDRIETSLALIGRNMTRQVSREIITPQEMEAAMGPLELGDFIGLDTVLSIMNVLYEGLADSKYRPCPLLTKYVEAGWLGRKAGRGFYDYRGEVPVPTR